MCLFSVQLDTLGSYELIHKRFRHTLGCFGDEFIEPLSGIVTVEVECSHFCSVSSTGYIKQKAGKIPRPFD